MFLTQLKSEVTNFYIVDGNFQYCNIAVEISLIGSWFILLHFMIDGLNCRAVIVSVMCGCSGRSPSVSQWCFLY